MNVLDSRCTSSVLTIDKFGMWHYALCGLPPEVHFSKLVNTLHLESNTSEIRSYAWLPLISNSYSSALNFTSLITY